MSNQIDNVCDICLGKKVTLTGKPCICEDGTLLGLLSGLRLQILKIADEIELANSGRQEEVVERYDLDDPLAMPRTNRYWRGNRQ